MGARPVTLLRKQTLINGDDHHLAVHTLTFSNPAGYNSLAVRIECGDVVKVCIPNYKPKSYSMSAERTGEFDITFKVYPGGRGSGFLDRMNIGDTVEVFRMGRMQRSAGTFIGVVAFGVGITEALPIVKCELAKSDAKRIVLLWAARTFQDTFWNDELLALKDAHGERFAHVFIFSQERRDDALFGRINVSVLRDVFERRFIADSESSDLSSRSGVRFLVVGTKQMMREANNMLAEMGYPKRSHALLH